MSKPKKDADKPIFDWLGNYSKYMELKGVKLVPKTKGRVSIDR